jgi:hypothetical protein
MAEKSKTTTKEFDASAEIDRVREGVIGAGDPADSPDARQRLAKQLVAAGVDLPEGVSVEPISDKDREQYVKAAEKRAAAARKSDAKPDADQAETDDKGGAASSAARTQPPQGRQARPTRTT